MRVLHARNVHQALPAALALLRSNGVKVDTRNGLAWQVPGGVTTVYQRPMERVLFHPARGANPFFHFYESMWMLAGKRDVESLTRYVPRMAEFSDDGVSFNAAYGYRWRNNWTLNVVPLDQLRCVVEQLRINPNTRQAVLQIWDLHRDLAGGPTRDHACNIAATFQVDPTHAGVLDMVVFCRSNDIVWGAYGANAVHMSYLLEYVARCAELSVGTYTQVSVNWHGYESTAEPLMSSLEEADRGRNTGGWTRDPYEPVKPGFTHKDDYVEPYPMRIHDQALFDEDLHHLTSEQGRAVDHGVRFAYHHAFFNDVAVPIVAAHDAWKDHRDGAQALSILQECAASDWRLACEQWIRRRVSKQQAEGK